MVHRSASGGWSGAGGGERELPGSSDSSYLHTLWDWCSNYQYSQQVLSGWRHVVWSSRCHLLLTEVPPTLAWVCVTEQISMHSYNNVTAGIVTAFPWVRTGVSFVTEEKISKPRNDASLAGMPCASAKTSAGPQTWVWSPLILPVLQQTSIHHQMKIK